MFVGLALTTWPKMLNPSPGTSNAGTVVGSVFGAISLLALLGIRYLLRCCHCCSSTLLWKVLWVLMWGIPLCHRLGLRRQAVGEGTWKSVG
jgi:hypothetical protein